MFVNGVIKVEEGVYRVTVAEAVYISPNKTLAEAIEDGSIGGTQIIQNPDGSMVAKGDTGEKGDKGDVGPQGLPGSQIFTGTQEPDLSIGNIGDYFIMMSSDVDTEIGGNIYKRELKRWELIGNIVPKSVASVSYVDKQFRALMRRIELLESRLEGQS